jgi:transcriptional regulator with XRE-family HTH domain
MSDGENIKNMRRKKGLTQEELGRLLGVKKSSISRWESGDRKVKLTTMRNIAGALNVPLEWLVNGLDPSGHLVDPPGDPGQADPVYGDVPTDMASIGDDAPPKAADAGDPDHIGAVSEIRGRFSDRAQISLTLPQIDDPELLSAFEGFKELDKLTPSDIEDIKAILKLAQRIIEKRKRGE